MVTFSKALSLPSDIKHLPLVEEVIDGLLSEGLLNEIVYGNVIVAATEAVLNGMNHGNGGDRSKLTRVLITIENNVLEMTVEDEGPGFDYNNLPDPTAPENLEKVNGRGIFIIRSLADQVEFERNGAKLKMTFKLDVKELVEA